VRRSLRILTILGILIAGLPSVAAADWALAPFIGRTFKGNTTLIDHEGGVPNGHWHFGAAVSMLGPGPFGIEGIFVNTLGFFEQENPSTTNGVPAVNIVKSRSIALMGNGVLAMPQRRTEYGLRPFVSGGIGLLHASATDFEDLTPVRTNLLGYNIGGGAIGYFTDRAGLRFDLRYFGTLKEREARPDEPMSVGPVISLRYWTAGVGFVFRY
jgi:opacity protein-like surface antigen